MIVEIHGLDSEWKPVMYGTVESTGTGVVFKVDADTEAFLRNYGAAHPDTGDRVEWQDGEPWVAGLLDTLQGTLIWAEQPEGLTGETFAMTERLEDREIDGKQVPVVRVEMDE